MTIHTDQQIVAIDTLKPHTRNPRRGNVDAIKESLAANGQFRPVVVNSRNNTIVAGHHLWRAAQDLGWTEIAVLWVDLTENEHRRMMLADNRTSDLGSYDMGELDTLIKDLLGDTGELLGTGYTDADLARLFGRPAEDYPTDPDDLPDKVRARSKSGEVWQLGTHRLAVGDATDPAVLDRLMAGERADVLWTDPPYGIDYVGKTKDAMTIQNDGAAGLDALLPAAFEAAKRALRPGAAVYIATPPGPVQASFWSAALAAFDMRQGLVWVKNTMVLGHSDYHYAHEAILYGFTPGGDGRKGRGGKRWLGDNTQTTVFEVPKPARSSEHPTMKPVDLVVQMLRNSAPPAGLVLDVFAGSGTTLVAADSLGLRANVVELDPEYADVILARWERLTGGKATRQK